MIPEVAQVFIDAPADEPRSRLEPYRAQILLWRRQGKSYRRIRQLLNESGVNVAYATLFDFVQRRKRVRAAVEAEVEAEGQSVTVVPAEPQQCAEDIAARRESARSVNQPVFEKKPDPKPRFVYDPSKPPVNKNYV